MDAVDNSILSILGRNCRVADATIAEALRISKDTVSYRVASLEREGLIEAYRMFIDARRLGYTRYHLLMRLENAVKSCKSMFESLRTVPYVVWINTFIGRFDMQVIVDARDVFHLNTIREAVFQACEHKIKDYSVLTCLYDLEFTNVSTLVESALQFERKDDFSFSNLLSERSFAAKRKFATVQVSKRDAEILRILSDEPRSTLTEVAKQVGGDRQAIKANIVRLIKSGVILNFGCVPGASTLGFVTYYLLMRFDQSISEKSLQEPFKRLQNVFYAGRMVGDYDVIVYVNARTPTQLNASIQALHTSLGNHLLHYDLLVQDAVHHWKHFADGIFADLR